MINTFEKFSNISPKQKRDSAGIVIIYHSKNSKPKILLVHATNGSWAKPVMGIPKGKIEDGESPEAAAFRETYEEIGIRIMPDQVERNTEIIQVYSGKTVVNNIHYLICNINNLSEIGLTGLIVPKSQLQSGEIDWAGFIDIDLAYSKIAAAQRIILDRFS
jgi:predicted NUDIX family NTP pyrophosphohydrolase